MKKLFLLLATVAMFATACTEGGIEDETGQKDPTEQPGNGGGNEDEIPTDKIVIKPAAIEVAAEASDYVVAVSSPCSWRATTENEWITIETKLGIDGKRELIFSVADSYEVEPREGKILISNSDEGLSAELVVTQKALVPEWSIDVETLHFEANGGEQTIEIVANFVEYQATSEVDWITFEYQEKGVVVKVATSNIDEERSAEITISKEKYDLSKTITIVQYAQDANRFIYYTSSDNEVVRPKTRYFNESIVSNTYNDNRGVIFFDAPVTSIGERAFYICEGLTSITIPNSVTQIGGYAFSGCTSLTSVIIGNGVTSIGEHAFYKCTSLTSITIPDSVTKIRSSAFRSCTSLTSVTIGNSVTSIGESAFEGCTSLTSVTIGNSVTSIGFYAFYKCTSLTSITIPDSVTSIGNYAFYKCTSLASVYCKPTTPPSGGSSMFYNNASGGTIYVPRNSVDAYKSATVWSDYSSYIVGYDF